MGNSGYFVFSQNLARSGLRQLKYFVFRAKLGSGFSATHPYFSQYQFKKNDKESSNTLYIGFSRSVEITTSKKIKLVMRRYAEDTTLNLGGKWVEVHHNASSRGNANLFAS